MLWLYWLGNLFQQYLGNVKTFQAYVLGGIFGGLIYMLAYNIFPAFTNQVPLSFALGASAGVLSIVVASATLLPEYSIQLLIIGQVRLKYIALFSVILDLISIPNGNAGGHIAHVGGAAFGYLFIKLIYSQSAIPNFLDKVFGGVGNWFKPSSTLKVRHKSKGTANFNNTKPNQQEIDFIEERDGQIYAFEFKWNKRPKDKIPSSFIREYNAIGHIVDKQNFREFILPKERHNNKKFKLLRNLQKNLYILHKIKISKT
jgi:hypothetical protein